MPARKSNVSMASNADDGGPPPPPKDGISVEDLSLPRTMVQRLAKGVLPPNTQIQKDALLAMSKGATVFVNYLTNTSWENAIRGGKKNINPKDVLEAVKELEFEGFLPRLEAELYKYNAIQCDKRNSYRKKVREAAKATKTGNPDSSDPADAPDASLLSVNGHRADADDEPPAAKKARRSSIGATEGEDEDEDEDMGEQADDDQPDEEHQDDDVEDDEEGEEKGEGEGMLVEDPLEIREDEDEGDEGDEGEDSEDSD